MHKNSLYIFLPTSFRVRYLIKISCFEMSEKYIFVEKKYDEENTKNKVVNCSIPLLSVAFIASICLWIAEYQFFRSFVALSTELKTWSIWLNESEILNTYEKLLVWLCGRSTREKDEKNDDFFLLFTIKYYEKQHHQHKTQKDSSMTVVNGSE